MAPRIREAVEADIPRLLELLAQLSLDAPSEDLSRMETYRAAFARMAGTNGVTVLVLEEDGRLLGTLTLYIMPNLSHAGAPWGLIENVVVDSSARGRGYGELLMRHAVELARAAGCYKVSLTSSKRRADAHRFYGRLGFTATHEGFRLDFERAEG
jgi:GNAT superfamily N-acetyltransferase